MPRRPSASVGGLLLSSVVLWLAEPAGSVYSSPEEVERAVLLFRRRWEGRTAEPPRACKAKRSNVIAMSLYGDERNFILGAVENCRLSQRLYTDWKVRVYTDCNETVREALRGEGAEVVAMERPRGVFGMSWRFLAAADECADWIVFRDTDSLLNPRERRAVERWMNSSKALHSMIDAPEHADWPMQGGMWGIRGGVMGDMAARIEAWGLWEHKLDDMHFLKHCVWEVLRLDALLHVRDGVSSPWGGEKFPEHEAWRGHVGEQEFLPDYQPFCPTRLQDPPADLLLNATAILRHNGLAYREMWRNRRTDDVQHTRKLAQSITHLDAARHCAQWAVEKDPSNLQAWFALQELLHVSNSRRPVLPSCASTSSGRFLDDKSQTSALQYCIRRIHRHRSRLQKGGARRAQAAGDGRGEAIRRLLKQAQAQGLARRKRLTCRVTGGTGRRLEAMVSCVVLALAEGRALEMNLDGLKDVVMDEIQLLYEASDEERGRRGDSEEVGTRCQLQVKTGGTRRDIQSMGINLSAAMDGLLCSGRSELEGCEQLEVELDGWLPVSLYNSNNRKILSPYLEPLGQQDVASFFFSSFVRSALALPPQPQHLTMMFSRLLRTSSEDFVVGIQIRTATEDEFVSSKFHSNFVPCAYAALPRGIRSSLATVRLVFLLLSDSYQVKLKVIEQIAAQEGGVVEVGSKTAVPPELGQLGLCLFRFTSGARALVFLPLNSSSSTPSRLHDLIEMWVVADIDLLVATEGSSFTNVGRSLALQRWAEEEKLRPLSYMLAREGSCLLRPNGEGPLGTSGRLFEDAPCWSERQHRRFSWSARTSPRPPRLS